MDPIRHPSHHHTLSYHDASCSGIFQCQGCGEDFDGPTFCCEICKFGLHKWCAQQPLVLFCHPLHPQHKLIMFVDDSRNTFICKECLLPFYGCLSYRCHHCDFKLHLSCAASTISQPSQKDGNRSSKKVSTFSHSFHTDHDLILYDQVHERMRSVNNDCEWCEKPILSAKFYACLPCQFFLHKACTFDVPYTIQHPCFREKYSLTHGGGFCFACRGQIRNCRFTWSRNSLRHLHPRCAILLPSLMSEYHGQHNLIYFEKENYREDFKCCICRKFGSTSDNHSGFYRCPECNLNFHLSCILPSTVEYKYHSCRSLVLKNPVKDDFYYEYYCDICETIRNPNYCVYSCQDCNFFDAHIECALNQIRDEQPYEPASIIQSLKVKPKAVLKETIHDQEHQMKHPSHPHLLSLDDIVNVKRLYRFCRGCKLKVFGQAFICMDCKDYCFHEECAKQSMSSNQLLESPLHPLHHLTLNFKHSQGKRFICDACGEIKENDCFNYQCQECEFVMEFKCAFMSEPISQGFKKLESPFHFFHRHMLFFGNYKNKQRFYCSICLHPISGLTYCCLVCDFFLHESCLRLFPPQLQPLLPLHSLQSFKITIVASNNLSCFACGIQLRQYDLCYSCDLNLHLHPTCCRTIVLTLPLVYEAHNHALYYFGRDFQIMFRAIGHDRSCSFNWFKCNTCHEYCTRSFYRCLEDKINFHLECAPIPQVVKSKCHRHCLKLKDSFFVEGYDHDDQYCDVCEEKRDSKNHVYICEECVYPIVGHIECVLSKMEKIIEATPRASTTPASGNELDSDSSKVIGDKDFVQTFEDEVLSVDLHPTKPWILVGFKENVCIWNYQSKKKEMSCNTTANLPQSSSVNLLLIELSVKFIALKNWIVIGAQDGFIYIYNYETSNFIHEFEAHTSQILCMFVHPSHPYVLSSSRDGFIRLWDWEKGWDCMQEFIGHGEEDLTNVVFIPRDHNTFASASVNGTILIWNVDSPYPIRGFRVCDQLNYIDIFMSGAELYLLTHQNGINSIEVWDFKTKMCVQTLGTHDEVTAISAHPEFPIIFTCWGETIGIWNSANYRLQKTLEFSELGVGGIYSIRCMEGSSHVAFAGYYGIAVVKITHSEDHNAINYQVDDEKKEESNKGKACIGEGSGKEIIK